jgi:peptidyl-prolyl cis-trans isomerase SurA
MNHGVRITALLAIAIAATVARAQKPSPEAPLPPPSSPAAEQPIELDHVVAIIGSNVLLESDVEQEMHFSALEPLSVLPGQNTPDSALRRLIDRTLILEQMKQQQQATATPAPEVAKSLAQLKKQIPACQEAHCETPQGWESFLKSNDLTEDEIEQRWSQRMAILQFIDIRFRSGIRISPDQIAAYYQKTLVPALEKDNQKAPPLADLSGRVREILLQQQVSGLFQDWLGSLRDQGNVQIVDPVYGADLESKPAAGEQ